MAFTLHYSTAEDTSALLKKTCLSKAAAMDMARKIMIAGGKALVIRNEQGVVASTEELQRLVPSRKKA